MTEHVVGPVGDFPEGKGVAVEAGPISVAVFKLDGEFHAIHNNCPHKNLPLDKAGWEVLGSSLGDVDAEACTVKCPWHRLEWDLDTGHNPVMNQDIPTYDVEVRDGDVVVIT